MVGLPPDFLSRLVALSNCMRLSMSGSREYTACEFVDGESTLDIACVIPRDLLISDVSMPGMTAIELAIALRQASRIAMCCYFPVSRSSNRIC